MIKIAFVDDHFAIRKGIQSILPRNMKMVYESDDIEDLIKNYDNVEADVIILDLNLCGKPGTETITHFLSHCPDANILVYSMQDSIPGVNACYDARAKGFISKGASVERLIEAIKHVASDTEKYYDPDIKEALLNYKFDYIDYDPRQRLTKKEFEIFKYLAMNKSVSEVAEILGISEKTIQNRSWDIGKKLNRKRHEFAEVAKRYYIVS